MRLFITLLFCFLMISCASESINPNTPPNENEEVIVNAFPNLSFDRPLNIKHAGDQSNRLFIEEQGGVIYVIENDSETSDKTVFLDISDRIKDDRNEQGLLGLAFHPDYETNGFFYVNYTAAGSGRTVISRFHVSENHSNQADPNSETEILSYSQPYSNHNGGDLAFGPIGYLYIGVGDGGGAGDPNKNAQDQTTLLGSILRINVDNAENGKEYGIPSDNPFINNEQGYREEIFAYGLRNPWRFNFDLQTNDLWTGDVGQNNTEEIHIIESGRNYGWNIIEGSECYQSSGCDKTGLELPIFEYSHSNGNRSVTGGAVYRGSMIPGLQGYYIYADFISGRVWALDSSDTENPENNLLIQTDFGISSFGTDQDNEIFICGYDGKIYRLSEGVVNQL